MVFQGTTQVANGNAEAGLRDLEQGFARYQELTTPPIFWPTLLIIRAQTHAAAGDIGRALAWIDEARTSLGDHHPAAADVAIAHSDLLLTTPPGDAVVAEALLERAAALSVARRARMSELQSLTRLAHLRQDGPAGRETLRRLRVLYEAFTEGHTTPPLRAAEAMLTNER